MNDLMKMLEAERAAIDSELAEAQATIQALREVCEGQQKVIRRLEAQVTVLRGMVIREATKLL